MNRKVDREPSRPILSRPAYLEDGGTEVGKGAATVQGRCAWTVIPVTAFWDTLCLSGFHIEAATQSGI
jgi:hypothetical protein